MRFTVMAGAALSLGLLACGDPPTQEHQPITSIRVEGRVLDQADTPVPGAFAGLHIWFSPKDTEPQIDPAFDGTGPDGTFTVGADGLGGAEIDSVGLEARAPGCTGLRSMKVISDLPEGPQAVLDEDLVVSTLPAPTTAVGEFCAIGSELFWGVGSYTLALVIDAFDGALVQGRWSVGYQRTNVGPEGTFEGVQGSGVLALVMTPVGVASCTELRLVIPVSATGAWGPAAVAADDGCLPLPDDLTFAPLAEPGYFP